MAREHRTGLGLCTTHDAIRGSAQQIGDLSDTRLRKYALKEAVYNSQPPAPAIHRYRCSLPGLTGFATLRCEEPL